MTNDGVTSVAYDTDSGQPVGYYRKEGKNYKMIAKVVFSAQEYTFCRNVDTNGVIGEYYFRYPNGDRVTDTTKIDELVGLFKERIEAEELADSHECNKTTSDLTTSNVLYLSPEEHLKR